MSSTQQTHPEVRVVRNLLKMMKTRGYTILFRGNEKARFEEALKENGACDTDIVLSVLHFAQQDHNGLLWTATSPRQDECDGEKKVGVFVMASTKKMGVGIVRGLDNGDFVRTIVVTDKAATIHAFKATLSMTTHVEFFTYDELKIDPTHHVYHRPYTYMEPPEVKAYLEKYTFKLENLQQLNHLDIMARWYGLKEGDCVGVPQHFPGVEAHTIVRRVVYGQKK